ncbi:MAG: dicarboxylate/amino acid:cation symporter [Pseudomonadota bacterium]
MRKSRAIRLQRLPFNRLSRQLDSLVKSQLWAQVLLAVALGAGVGVLLGPDLNLVTRSLAALIGDWLALPGQLFLALISMVIIPLAASSIILGVAGSGGGETLQKVGVRLIAFIGVTTFAATIVGVTLARLIQPGLTLAPPSAIPPTPSLKPDLSDWPFEPSSAIGDATRGLPDLIAGIIPQNISVSLVEQDMLAIVVFSLFIGFAILRTEKKELTRPLLALAGSVLEVCMTVIRTAMRFAPVAVFGLIAQTAASNGYRTMADLAMYCVTVLAGLSVLFAIYLGMVAVFGRMKPLDFLRRASSVLLLAFSTSSSAAVLPLTLQTAVRKFGAPEALAGAVIPLAATMNMAGTALYQATAIIFLANIGGASLSNADIALIMMTLTGASIGAPAAPGASVAIISVTAASYGVPLTGLPLIVGVDRLLDMSRTLVNVAGDLVLTRILSPTKPPVASETDQPSAPGPALRSNSDQSATADTPRPDPS